MSGQMKTRCWAAAIIATVALAPGCEKPDALTLREAEDWAYEWLWSVEHFLETPPGDEASEESDEALVTADADEWDGPETLRDCFVDDDWQPAGFKNPTQAINWLTSAPRRVGRVQSIDLVDGVSEIVFVLDGSDALTASATVIIEDGFAKCSAFTVSSDETTQSAE